MGISEAKRWAKLRQWSEMIQARNSSGKTVKDWCDENGICKKTYYYRLKSVRLAALEEPDKASEYFRATLVSQPVFVKLPLAASGDNTITPPPAAAGVCAMTVRMGSIIIDINNGADPDLIVRTMCALREIC